ncbi:MAG: LamG domain-containing protein [Polyangiales bacterium]
MLRDHYARWIAEGDATFSNLHAYGCDGGRRLNPRAAVSASAWVRTRDADAIVALKFGTTWQLAIAGGRATARVVTDTPSGTRPETVFETAGARTVNDGAWHHLALTWSSATATLSLYVDGTLDRSTAATGSLVSGSGRVDLGGYDYGSGRCCFLDGDLDDVRLHARALTAAEVATLARCTTSDDCGVADEAVAWSFEGDGSDRLGNEPVSLPAGGAFAPGRAGLALHLDGASQHAITRNWYGTLPLPTFWLGKLTGQIQDGAGDPAYCHAVTDIDLWILSGMVELLGARARDPASVALTTADERAMRAAVALGLPLAERALVETALRDRAGASTHGAVFDPGMWNEHPDWFYAGYEGAPYPTASDRATSPSAGWDLSHATRYVWAFGSLHELRAVTGSSFPSPRVMQGLAHQFAYRIFEGDLARPRFRNFFDGANGWYRVGYDGRPGFGYQPWDLSAAALEGYGFWSEHDPAIAPVLDALWAMVNSRDPAVVAFRDAHYYRYWQSRDGALVRQGGLDEGMRRTYATLTFAPTFARRP